MHHHGSVVLHDYKNCLCAIHLKKTYMYSGQNRSIKFCISAKNFIRLLTTPTYYVPLTVVYFQSSHSGKVNKDSDHMLWSLSCMESHGHLRTIIVQKLTIMAEMWAPVSSCWFTFLTLCAFVLIIELYEKVDTIGVRRRTHKYPRCESNWNKAWGIILKSEFALHLDCSCHLLWYSSTRTRQYSNQHLDSFPGRLPLHFLTAHVIFELTREAREGPVHILRHQTTNWTWSWHNVKSVSITMATCPRTRIASRRPGYEATPNARA